MLSYTQLQNQSSFLIKRLCSSSNAINVSTSFITESEILNFLSYVSKLFLMTD